MQVGGVVNRKTVADWESIARGLKPHQIVPMFGAAEKLWKKFSKSAMLRPAGELPLPAAGRLHT